MNDPIEVRPEQDIAERRDWPFATEACTLRNAGHHLDVFEGHAGNLPGTVASGTVASGIDADTEGCDTLDD